MKQKLLSTMLCLSLILALTACDTRTTTTDESVSKSNVVEGTDKSSNKAENKYCTFRNSAWGDTISQVEEQENDINFTATSDGRGLVGKGSIQGYDCYVVCSFNNNKLYRGVYSIPPSAYSAGFQYISAYEILKEKLYNKYGNSVEDTIVNLKQQSLIDMAGPSSALEYGYVVYRAKWETADTDVMISMMAEDYEITLNISYTDKNYDESSNNDGL